MWRAITSGFAAIRLSATGIPAARKVALERCLSIASAEASTPEWV